MRTNKILLTIFTVSFIFLHGCSTTSSVISGNVGASFSKAYKAISSLISGYEDHPITRELVDQIPYASLRMKIGKGPAGLLILESKKGDEYTWVSADNVYIITKEGRIIRALGLTNNLTDVYSSEPSFKEILQTSDSLTGEKFRYVSLDNPEAFNIRVKVSYKKIGPEDVSILDRTRQLILIEEKIENAYIKWRHINKYWVDQETGFVMQSFQVIAPNLPPILIQVTKKPSQ
tara:strand:+ start:361 stop:1056 length:696 start_codon:yes stop_codon:yes gene_type:complete